MPDSVMWFRRDLRLGDNPALTAAVDYAQGGDVLALFILDDALLGPSGEMRKSYMYESLHALNEQLDGNLVVQSGDPVTVLRKVAKDRKIFAANDFGPYGTQRDKAVDQELDIEFIGSPYAVDPGSVVTSGGTPFKVFTPYSRAWQAHGWSLPLKAPRNVKWASMKSDEIPTADKALVAVMPPIGEIAVRTQYKDFVANGLADYKHNRDLPAVDGTSRLSAALRWGAIHPRTVLAELGAGEGARTFRNEISWRDFYAEVLFTHPRSAREDLNPLGRVTYDTGKQADERFEAWCAGETGYPIVDAGMRQLLGEGWMHNRVRMITASFLVKDLHLWWRRGARHFMQHLVDGDLASNQHGWQWSSGTGTDAAPYFRVFNPTTQGERFDPNGAYIKRWVPELADLPVSQIHEPWAQPKRKHGQTDALFSEAKTLNYPKPIVDHAVERDETLARYKAR